MSLILRDVGLLQHGPTLSMTIENGETLCVVGPGGSGKSKLAKILSGQQAPDRGDAELPRPIQVPEPANRKLRPQDLSHKKGENRALLATEILSHLGLWESRQNLISDLSPSRIAACDLVETFMGHARLLVFDEHLDRLDPWTRAEVLRLIRDRCANGAIAVAATNCLEMAEQFDHLIVLKDQLPVHAGRVFDLVKSRGQRSVVVESERSLGVRALVDPLLVEVAKIETGYRLTPGPGQERTAKLLREGYGDVKFIISDEKPLAEIIRTLL